MKNAFEELEFNKVKALIKNHCTSSLGEKLVDQLQPLTNKSEIEKRLSELYDAVEFLSPLSRGQKNSFNLDGLADTESLFPQLKSEEYFTIQEFLSFYRNIKLANALRKNEAIKERNFPHLFNIVKDIVITARLEKQFEGIFDFKGEIKDSASENLSKIRKKRKKTKKRIYTQLEDILTQKQYENVIQDKIVTIRDQRYVIPIKEGGSSILKGIMHGHSQTAASVFLEPLSAVELNNWLINLDEEERAEIQKILRGLYHNIQEQKKILLQNLKILQKIDFLNATAQYCREIGATVPKILGEPSLRFINACHPLLYSSINEKDKIVPFSLNLGDEFRTLVISGVNTGGKTVTLKAIGLLTLMALSGLMIPAENAEIGIFRNFFTDINDEQSIEDSISTFSSHIEKIKIILNQAEEKSLVLIDELGSGTDPEEGSALAQAILEKLVAKKSRVVITTHLNKLKIFASEHPLCENASMRFNQENLSPTYQLDVGFPGSSYAIDIAREYELTLEVVNRADELIDQKTQQLSYLLKRTEQQRLLLSRKINEYELKTAIAAQNLKSLQEKEENWGKIERQLKQKTVQEAEEYLTGLQQNFEKELNKLKILFKKEKKIEPKSRGAAFGSEVRKFVEQIEKEKNKIKQKKEELAEIKLIPLKNPKVGNFALIKPLNIIGKIVRRDKDCIRIMANGITYKIHAKDLYQVPENKKVGKISIKADKSAVIHTEVSYDFGLELNIIGLTFGEAQPKIDKYIDKAILLDLQKIRILHGKGTGQLRKKIWEYFKKDSRISDYYSAPEKEGGSGVTIAVIK
jgi:DNA mismatch repair protein MutS2